MANAHFDLITPDGAISKVIHRQDDRLDVYLRIESISPKFVGFDLEEELLSFNLKSTLAQLGLNAVAKSYFFDKRAHLADVNLSIYGIDSIGRHLLQWIDVGCYLGKIFAKKGSRKVRDPDYLFRMFNRCDRDGMPLLSLGGERKELHLEKIEGRTVALLPLLNGTIEYDPHILGLLPTIGGALRNRQIQTRQLLSLHQIWKGERERITREDALLLVRTAPLHVRTVFGRVIDTLLPEGVYHTSADILQPDTKASGDLYELFGNGGGKIDAIPLEFYTLEPEREHVFFSDRDQLQSDLENREAIFQTFEKAPDKQFLSSVFIVKGEQLRHLSAGDWIYRDPLPAEPIPLLLKPETLWQWMLQEPSYPFLKAIELGSITSQGVLFSRYFPSPLIKRMLLGDLVQHCLKRIYFQTPSHSHGDFFSHEDRSMLLDLTRLGIQVFWADRVCGRVLQFAPKPEKDTGMFVPIEAVDTFAQATAFGVYGSTLVSLDFEEDLSSILEGILAIRDGVSHPLLHKGKPIVLITGGGPGVMETSNRVATKLGILSCGNIVDFSDIKQPPNPYLDGKMTYRLDKLIERQSEFNLDFPIFMMGGFGTDFEFALEQVRRKVQQANPTPIILLGSEQYWKEKITPPYLTNKGRGTIAGAEWVSNCFYYAKTPSAALAIYRHFFAGTLPIGVDHPPAEDGFFIAP